MPTNTQSMDYAGSTAPLFSEILTKVNNAKDKPKKIAVLKEHDTVALRQILKGAFDPKIEWDLPEGAPPYKVNEAPAGTEHTILTTEAKRLWHFVKGADPRLSKAKKETMFIQMLEGLHADEAQLLLDVKDKKLNTVYKGLTDNVVKEAFGWNDDYKTA
mgnify:CR=1 FL=1|tara:strand:- start:313 stop:789 length:477 start_codon:yes stop_codon:yes gene_type:complete